MFIADANRHIRRVLDDIIMTNLSLSTAALKTKTNTHKKKIFYFSTQHMVLITVA